MILICFGTRPEWLKIKPLLEVLNDFKIFFTGQHEDLLVNELNKFSDKIIKAQIHSNSNNRLNNISSSILDSFPEDKFEALLVQGDTASAFACALAGFNNGIKVIYLESGLRSFDLKHPYPEEGYRQMISRISDINLCPTELSLKNLESENNIGVNYIVGNTVLDNIKHLKTKSNYENIVLITLHRRENLPIIDQWLEQIKKVAKSFPEIEFIIVEHPNKTLNINNINNLTKIHPKGHNDFLKLLVKCKLIITDSGGLQEEGSFLNKKIIVCRKVTERPEGINTGHIYLSKTPDELYDLFESLINNYSIDIECPYGDGNSSNKIVKILKENDISA